MAYSWMVVYCTFPTNYMYGLGLALTWSWSQYLPLVLFSKLDFTVSTDRALRIAEFLLLKDVLTFFVYTCLFPFSVEVCWTIVWGTFCSRLLSVDRCLNSLSWVWCELDSYPLISVSYFFLLYVCMCVCACVCLCVWGRGGSPALGNVFHWG